MSTSEQTLVTTAAPEVSNVSTGLPGSEGITSGILSPAELARMANEMFNALPDELQQPAINVANVLLPPNSAFTGNPHAAVPSATAPAVPGALGSLTEAQPGILVSTPDRGAAPGVRPSGPASMVPAVSRGGIDPLAGPAFAFLAEARPLFVEPAAEPAPQHTRLRASGNAVPSEEGFAAIPSLLLPKVQPSKLTTSPQPPAPAVPGALGAVDSSAIPAFSFLEEARPLFSTPPTIPGPIPAGALPEKPDRAEKSTSIDGNPFAAPLDLDAPQLSVTVVHAPNFRARPTTMLCISPDPSIQ